MSYLDFVDVNIGHGDKQLFINFNWTVSLKDNWAIVGPNSSGKSSLLQAIAGKLMTSKGCIYRTFLEDIQQVHPQKRLTDVIALVPAKNKMHLAAHPDMYYQQRYQATEADNARTAREVLLDIKEAYFTDGMELHFSEDDVKAITELLHVDHLLDKSVIKLSNGESKRLQLAGALLRKPALLLLDDPFMGLDIASRELLKTVIDRIIHSGTKVIMVAPATELPESISHVLVLKQNGQHSSLERLAFIHQYESEPIQKLSINNVLAGIGENIHSGFSNAIHMRDVNVAYGETTILNNITWLVKKGEKWALQGPNGSGKSTLLSLINGDNPQAYRNNIELFDRRRGTGESIWDLKKKIGYISPELHQYFPRQLTCAKIVASGFTDSTVVAKKLSVLELEQVNKWMKIFGIEELVDKPFAHIATAEQRLVLLARALIKKPALLLLDEPCQGLDDHHITQFKQIIDTLFAGSEQTLVYVTHYADELPSCIERVISLDNGNAVIR